MVDGEFDLLIITVSAYIKPLSYIDYHFLIHLSTIAIFKSDYFGFNEAEKHLVRKLSEIHAEIVDLNKKQSTMRKVERVITEGYRDGYEVIEAPLPALVTASNEVGELRPATVMALLEARKKVVTVWDARELGLDSPLPAERANMLRLFIPVREANCDIVSGKDPRQAGKKLALKLREDSLI